MRSQDLILIAISQLRLPAVVSSIAAICCLRQLHTLIVEGATTADAGVLAAPLPPPVDPAKAAAEAEAEALRLANLEALKKMNVIRRWCVRISTHEDFELVVFVLIFVNIVTLAMYNPLKTDKSGYNFILDRIRKPLTTNTMFS